MANELNAEVEKARRFFLPIGSLILLFLILLPVALMRVEDSPLAIALAILSLTCLFLGVLLYYRPHHCTPECGKWLPPFNTAIIAALCFTIGIWALADLDYNVKAPMVMILIIIAAFFTMSEGTYLWKLH